MATNCFHRRVVKHFGKHCNEQYLHFVEHILQRCHQTWLHLAVIYLPDRVRLFDPDKIEIPNVHLIMCIVSSTWMIYQQWNLFLTYTITVSSDEMSIIEWNRPCFTILTTRFNLSHSFLYFCHFFWTQKTKYFTNLSSVSSVSTVATIFASDAWWTLNALDAWWTLNALNALRTLDTSIKKEEKIFFLRVLSLR